ncbi:MAG TPA: type I-C CRISPR-associated protein Cas8c/Csd1, partial [Patescibacteria group bacterium]|nr:type I-C CRISPR-associated protein Cas8c/Csd1 [Patescibacteria group bacterium]
MILQALYEHYQRLLDDPASGVAPPGYSRVKVSHALSLDKNGNLVDILSLRYEQNKKSIPQVMCVFEQIDHSVEINANYLCDNGSYVLGLEVEKKDKQTLVFNKRKFEDFRNKNMELLKNVRSDEADAVLRFLVKWDE